MSLAASHIKMPFTLGLFCLLSACVSNVDSRDNKSVSVKPQNAPVTRPMAFQPVGTDPHEMYGQKTDANFVIPAVNAAKMDPSHVRQIVNYYTQEAPGTIVVDQKARFLYFILPDGKAIRYAVGVGPVAREFDGGEAVIARKAAWPRWIPTPDMVKRSPEHYGRYKDGVNGGPKNPMGARALYMHKNGRDTYYRVHGTNDPTSIGKAVSAGCIRLLNQDIMDLYGRVQPGAKILVKS